MFASCELDQFKANWLYSNRLIEHGLDFNEIDSQENIFRFNSKNRNKKKLKNFPTQIQTRRLDNVLLYNVPTPLNRTLGLNQIKHKYYSQNKNRNSKLDVFPNTQIYKSLRLLQVWSFFHLQEWTKMNRVTPFTS